MHKPMISQIALAGESKVFANKVVKNTVTLKSNVDVAFKQTATSELHQFVISILTIFLI